MQNPVSQAEVLSPGEGRRHFLRAHYKQSSHEDSSEASGRAIAENDLIPDGTKELDPDGLTGLTNAIKEKSPA